MRQVLRRSATLLRHRGVLLLALLIAAGGSALVWLPLFNLPGYELSAALAVLVGVLGGFAGIGAAHQRPAPGLTESQEGRARTGDAVLATSLVLSLAAMVPFAVSTLTALVGTRCDPFAQVEFFPLLVLPSALLAASAGVLAGTVFARTRWAAALHGVVLGGSAAVSLWPIYAGPQVYAFNHFAGYLPGPLYDEALELTAGLVWFRVETMLLAIVATLLASLLRGHFGFARVGVMVVAVVGVGSIERAAPSLSLRMSPKDLATALGGYVRTEHVDLFHSTRIRGQDVARFVRELEFRLAQLHAFFQLPQTSKTAAAERIKVYLYASPDEKQRLVGAGKTQFAKPWRRELHVDFRPLPHPILKHELAHVVAAPFGAGPFAVTSSLGVWPHIGIIEGLAVAADDRADDLTLHEWSAGMRRNNLMPDVRRLLSPAGFYVAAPARAYTTAGSLLRYLADTYGAEKLRALYAHGDFEGVYGRGLDELATEWERFLDALPLDARAVDEALARFRRGSIFARACAREVEELRQRGGELFLGAPAEAAALFTRASALQPDDHDLSLSAVRALLRAGARQDAEARLEELMGRPALPASSMGAALALKADGALERGDVAAAQEALSRLASLSVGEPQLRTAQVKLLALEAGPVVSSAIFDYFRDDLSEDLKLYLLKEGLEVAPGHPALAYLLGRRLALSERPQRAPHYLAQALGSGGLSDIVKKEAYRLLLLSQFRAGDCAGVEATVGQLPDFGAAFRAGARDWVERCAFERRVFKGPLVPEGPFG